MTPELVVDLGQETLMVVTLLAAPPLLTALAVGLAIGMLQAATQVQEMTLSFIPKLLAMFAALLLSGHWMLALLIDFTERLYEGAPGMVG
ncbi:MULTISPECIES: flagellar biosynthesis protein FliQ [unclassified Thioalkalivibrio]|uniref:flagellar biosynthesis protein FliQ n=1 Tax=unclassified Thioalkalivibrio TaxID=2621013 RepID=UPI000382A69F|nr:MULTISPECIES: flagellar biosynthesis protein FliQ [unclassified Thioalkalivibrio]